MIVTGEIARSGIGRRRGAPSGIVRRVPMAASRIGMAALAGVVAVNALLGTSPGTAAAITRIMMAATLSGAVSQVIPSTSETGCCG